MKHVRRAHAQRTLGVAREVPPSNVPWNPSSTCHRQNASISLRRLRVASDKASSTQETGAGTYCSVSTVRQTVPTVVTNTPYIQLLVGHNLASGGHTTYQNPHKVWRWSTARKRTPKLCSVAEGGLRCIHSLESTRAHGDPSLRQASGMVQSTVKSASSLPPSSPACMICALPGYKVIQTTQ